MFRFIVIATLFALATTKSLTNSTRHLSPRVNNGSPAREGEFPYQVSIRYDGVHFCGGSIISDTVILTAAHCVYNKDFTRFTVRAGTVHLYHGDGYLTNIVGYKTHPLYDETFIDYDIAVIRLPNRLPFGDRIQYINMIHENDPRDTGVATLSGWGQNTPDPPQPFSTWNIYPALPTPPEILQYAKIPLWDINQCSALIKGITTRMFCAGDAERRVHSCPGDSGGPLVKDFKLIGIVSWGFGCGGPTPAVATHVLYLRDWVRQVTGI